MARTWPDRQSAEAEFATYIRPSAIPLIRFDALTGSWTTVNQAWLDRALAELATLKAEKEFPNG